jgi:uncharacterized protein YdeI (YjbR/CyaY-like superfamily)
MPAARGSESKPIFFKSAAEYRAWLEKNHTSATELWIGYWKKATGKPSMTWQDTVDESLCFGWIDGIRKGIDADSFKQRVTPRRPTSIWSKVNIRHVARLTEAGRMHPAGQAAFEKRDRTKAYSYEQDRDQVGLGPAYEAQFRKENRKAWDFFQQQPPGYRRLGGWYVMSAKKEETRQKRLAVLIRDSAAGRRLAGLTPKKKPPV